MAPGLGKALWIVGTEIGEGGTPHLQGYVEFPTKVRPIGYKGFPKEIHWGDKDGKPARGTREENINYCSKDEGEPHFSGHGPLYKRPIQFPDSIGSLW